MVLPILAPVYILINYWMYRQIVFWSIALDEKLNKVWIKVTFAVVFFGFCLTPLIGVLLPNGNVKFFVTSFGNYWLGINAYLWVIVGVIVFVRFVNRKIKKLPKERLTKNNAIVMGATVFLAVLIILGGGIVSSHNIQTTDYDIDVNKSVSGADSLNAVLVADLHLGFNIGIDQISQMVEKINACNPDIVFIAGDVFDNNFDAVQQPEAISNELKKINTKFGVYACYGNHDIAEKILAGFTFSTEGKTYDSDPRMDKFLADSNIKLLRDKGELVGDSFYVFGRKDYKQIDKNKETRLSPEEIVADMDKSKPIIVIDHEPRELHELSDAGVDADLCGHTHNGQMFPINLLTKIVWENSYGLLKIGNMTNIVTSGVGLYGPNMRIMTFPEVCNIKINFNK